MQACTHARTHARTHAHIYTHTCMIYRVMYAYGVMYIISMRMVDWFNQEYYILDDAILEQMRFTVIGKKLFQNVFDNS